VTDVDVESDADGLAAPQPPVELVIPADTRAVRLARLVTSGVASASGFDVEEVEDLRIAVDELCAVLLACDTRDVLRLSWRSSPGAIEILASADVKGTP
jgi:serine/threonine-protein kinase RsbW